MAHHRSGSSCSNSWGNRWTLHDQDTEARQAEHNTSLSTAAYTWKSPFPWGWIQLYHL